MSRRKISSPPKPENSRASLPEPVPPKDVARLEKRIGYKFRRRALVAEALMHSSFVNERPDRRHLRSYERMEFLGDAVLDFIIAETAFHAHLEWDEGELSKLRGLLAGEPSLVEAAKRLKLESFIRLGSGEPPGVVRPSIMADAFESIVAAVYLDGGMAAARKFVLKHFEKPIRAATRQTLDRANFKSRLQEVLQSVGHGHPRYAIERESGPAHAKRFFITVELAGKKYRGDGLSKQSAEQDAARQALIHLKKWIHRLRA